MSRTPELNEKRIENYRRLRCAGFSVKEATRYKDRKQPIIDKLISAIKGVESVRTNAINEALNG